MNHVLKLKHPTPVS